MSLTETQAFIHDDLSREVYCVLGIPIDAVDMSGILRNIQAASERTAPFVLSTPNLNFLVNSQTDPEFRESLLLSDLCPPDGMPIVWISRLLGLPITRRIAGSDIFEAIKSRPKSERPLNIFLFGSTQQVAAEAARRLNSHSCGVKCVGWLSPGFVDVDELSQHRFMEQINSSKADFLVAALGAKKGQLWLHRNRDRLRVPIRAHLGATINFQAGAIKRAPYFMQRLGLEWLWRIREEPSLFKRYWHDGRTLLRLLPSRILPLAAARWCKDGRGGSRHDFVIVSAQNEQTVRLRIAGHAVSQHVPKAVACFREALGRQKAIVVDLSQTQAIDARFFGLLLMLRKELMSRGFTLQFASLTPTLEKLFRQNGVEYLLTSSEHHNERHDVDFIN